MLTKQKLAPTNKIVDAMYDKYILPTRTFKRKVSKAKSLVGNGKLKENDIDMIRYLTLIGIQQKYIAVFYGVSKSTINRIRNQDMFSKYLSPFEFLDKFLVKHIDREKLSEWVEINKLEIEETKLNISNLEEKCVEN